MKTLIEKKKKHTLCRKKFTSAQFPSPFFPSINKEDSKWSLMITKRCKKVTSLQTTLHLRNISLMTYLKAKIIFEKIPQEFYFKN